MGHVGTKEEKFQGSPAKRDSELTMLSVYDKPRSHMGLKNT